MKRHNKMLSLFLAVIMLLTFTVPAYAAVPDSTFDLAQAWEVSDSGMAEEENIPESESPQENEPADPTNEPTIDPFDSTAEDSPDAADESDVPTATAGTTKTSGELSEAELLAAMEQWLNNLRVVGTPSGGGIGIAPFAAPGDTGTIVHSTISIRPYDVTVPGVGRAYGSVIWRMKIKGEDAFCLQIWKLAGGTYTAGDATSGNGATAQYIANFMASGKSNAEYVAAQVLVWESLYGNIGIYSQSIQGTSFESAYHALKNASAEMKNIMYWTSNTGGQEIATFATGEPPDPELPPDIPDDPDEEVPPTETVTTTSTRTEVRGNTTYEYSDALGQITVAKRDNEGKSLDGAIFNIQVKFANGQTAGDSAFEVYNGSRLFTYTHPADDHAPATVTVTEVRAPDGYIGDPTPKTAIVHPTYTRVTKVTTTTITITTTSTTTTNIETGEVLAQVDIDSETALDPPMVQEYVDFVEGDRETTMTFVNTPKPCSLTIYKYSKGEYSQALSGAKFRIRYADPNMSAQVWTLSTGADGKIVIDLPHEGTLIVEELEAPANHVIGSTSMWEVVVAKGEDKRIDISNDKKADIIAYKKDAQTGQLLAGATIKATLLRSHTPPYEQNMTYTVTTDADGKAVFSNVIPGEYRLEEQSPPQFYLGTSVVHNVSVFDGSNEPVTVTFHNEPWTGLTIKKVDATNGRGLQGAVFKLYGGTAADPSAFLGDFQSNENGLVVIQDLESNKYYTIVEAQAPYGYFVDDKHNVQTVLIKPEAIDENMTVIFRNMPKMKLDAVTKEPLQGVKFRVTKMNGEYVGDYVTNASGYFAVSDLEPDWYTAYETATIAGYVLDATPQNIQIKKGELAVLEFTNKPLNGLQIKKVDSVTGEPLGGVEFKVTEMDGRLVGNYTTDSAGLVFVPDLKEGWIIITETRGIAGYKPDYAPRNVEIKTGKLNVVEYRNQPYPHLIVQKIDSDTKQPLEGVRFKLMDKYSREIGIFTTNAQGQIHLTGMDEGEYSLQEYEAKSGYVLDATARKISLQWGKTTTVEVKNIPMGSLRIKKVDAITGKPIPGTTFIVYDSKNNILGEYVSDDKGIVELPRSLAAQKLKIKESKAAPGYVLDEQVRTIEIKAGETTEILWENQPELGRIQIVKKSADDNPVTRDKAGKLLSGAVFEICDKDLNVVDEITTDSRGVATSVDLPLGTYALRETVSPSAYYTEGAVFYAEIKKNADLVRFEVLNKSKDISVTVEKRGNVEVIAGDEMKYDFSCIANTSNIPLDDFFWHDQLPASDLRLKQINTGTWTEKLTYSVTYKTNLKSAYKTLAANLSSQTSHNLDCSPAALKLASNEYITDIRFNFGTVKAGFREDETPSFIVTTLATLPDGYRIVNHTDVGGKSGDAEVTAKDMWVTVTLGKPKGCLPRTGHSMSGGW